MIESDPVVLLCSFVLLMTLLLGLVRALRGPTLEDRMLSVQLLGTGGVAVLLLLADVMATRALLDVALALALLAAVAAAALTRREVDRG